MYLCKCLNECLYLIYIKRLALYFMHFIFVKVSHSKPTSCSSALILVLKSTLLCSIFIFSLTNCPTYCLRNATSLISIACNFLKSFSKLAMSSMISLRVSLFDSVALCSKVAKSERSNWDSFLFSFKPRLKSYMLSYKTKIKYIRMHIVSIIN